MFQQRQTAIGAKTKAMAELDKGFPISQRCNIQHVRVVLCGARVADSLTQVMHRGSFSPIGAQTAVDNVSESLGHGVWIGEHELNNGSEGVDISGAGDMRMREGSFRGCTGRMEVRCGRHE